MHDLTDRVFGRWTVLRRSEKRSRGVRCYWECRCECGNVRDVLTTSLTSGSSTGCEECRLRSLHDEKTKYPWAEWLSGRKFTVDSQAEYGITPQVLRQSLYMKARAEGLVVNTEIEESRVTFQFRRECDPQIISAHGGRRDSAGEG